MIFSENIIGYMVSVKGDTKEEMLIKMNKHDSEIDYLE